MFYRKINVIVLKTKNKKYLIIIFNPKIELNHKLSQYALYRRFLDRLRESIFPTYVVPIDIATSSDINEPIIIALAIMHLNLLPSILAIIC